MVPDLFKFELRPRFSSHFDKLYIGFFESREEQAWVRIDLNYVDNPDWWARAAETLAFHAGTCGLSPTNKDLAGDLYAFYKANQDGKIRAGRPTAYNRGGEAAGDTTRAEPQGAGGGDGLP